MDTAPIEEPLQYDAKVPAPADASRFPSKVGVVALALVVLAGGTIALEYSSVGTPRAQTAAIETAADPFAGISLIGKAAEVVDIKTGTTLFELNPDVQLPLASLTKVPLVLAVSEVLRPDAVITIPYDTAPKGSSERLGKGEKWRVADVISFTLVASSNGGADILATAANADLHARYPQSPDTPPAGGATLWRMNDLAKTLGLTRTYFLNASGLDLSLTQSGAYGSARDMTRLFAYAASANPGLFAGTARDGVLLTSADGGSQTSAFNTNDAQGTIQGLIMGKTGFTDLAGGNLVVVFDVGLAHPVVAVVLGSTEAGRFTDMQKLVDAARIAVSQGK